jgi:rhamnogalacturonyl hydrolase YesR
VAHLFRGWSQPFAAWSLSGIARAVLNVSGRVPLRWARLNSWSYVVLALMVRLILIPGLAASKSLISLSMNGAWLTQ